LQLLQSNPSVSREQQGWQLNSPHDMPRRPSLAYLIAVLAAAFAGAELNRVEVPSHFSHDAVSLSIALGRVHNP
jgi:hypothetical protein